MKYKNCFNESNQLLNVLNGIYTLVFILGIHYVGKTISNSISDYITIPGNIIGMGLLFGLLQVKVIRFERIKVFSEFVLKHFSLFFIPFGVSIIQYYPSIKSDLLKIVVIIFISTFFSLLSSVWLVEKVGD
jgi:holin-like protein